MPSISSPASDAAIASAATSQVSRVATVPPRVCARGFGRSDAERDAALLLVTVMALSPPGHAAPPVVGNPRASLSTSGIGLQLNRERPGRGRAEPKGPGRPG